MKWFTKAALVCAALFVAGPAYAESDFPLRAGVIVCSSLYGLQNVSDDMNKDQLDSLGCGKAGGGHMVSYTGSDGYDPRGYVRLRLVLPTQVVLLWARLSSDGVTK
jgi:hypothetical protein